MNRILPPLLVWGALLGWHYASRHLSCSLVAITLVIVTMLIALSSIEEVFVRRHLFLTHYFQQRGRVYRLLSRKTFMIVIHGLRSLFLAFVLLVSTMYFSRGQWIVLLGGAALLYILVFSLSSVLSIEIRNELRDRLVRQWALRINALVMWCAILGIQLLTPHENYTGMRWEEVLAYSAAQIPTACDVLGLLTRVVATSQAVATWGAQNLFVALSDPAHVLIVWTVFLGAFGVSLAVCWAYSRALVGSLARPWTVWDSRSS